MTTTRDLLIKELVKFSLQLELAYNKVFTKFVKFIHTISTNEQQYQEWFEKEYTYLNDLQEKCKDITTSKKVKASQLEFLTSVKLFNDSIQFEQFANENKNTKKGFAIYITSVYKLMNLITQGKERGLTDSEIVELYNNVQETAVVDQPKQTLGGVHLQNLMGDMISDFQSGEMNPMELLQEIMKGPEASKDSQKLKKFTEKFEQKLKQPQLQQELNGIMKNMNLADLIPK